MKAYSNDLRKRVIDARINGEKVVDIAERFSVRERFVYSLLKRFRETGSYEAKKPSGGAPRKISLDDEAKIQKIVEEKPDSTLAEIKEQANLTVSITTIHRATKRLNMTFKKKRFIPKNKIRQGYGV